VPFGSGVDFELVFELVFPVVLLGLEELHEAATIARHAVTVNRAVRTDTARIRISPLARDATPESIARLQSYRWDVKSGLVEWANTVALWSHPDSESDEK
jgi:hypothetical protein